MARQGRELGSGWVVDDPVKGREVQLQTRLRFAVPVGSIIAPKAPLFQRPKVSNGSCVSVCP